MWRGWRRGTKNRKVFWSSPKCIYKPAPAAACRRLPPPHSLPPTLTPHPPFWEFCVRENKFYFQGQPHGAYWQIKGQLCEHFYQSQEPLIPGRWAFYVSALVFPRGLCTGLKLVYVIKMFHLRLHKWLIPLCSMASVSGKKIVWNSMATVLTCWRLQLKD